MRRVPERGQVRMRTPVATLAGSLASSQNIRALSMLVRSRLMTPDAAHLPDGFASSVSLSTILMLVTCVTVTLAWHWIVEIENVPVVAPSGSTRVVAHRVTTPFAW